MPVTLSQAAFCALILESGLITENRLTSLRKQFEREGPARNPENCLEFTEYLVRTNELTLWQAQKLVQGKHKGFRIGKYKLLSLLGRGGMSSVYLAEHTVMRRRCAIKILPFKQVKNAAALSRFYREAQAVAALDNPHIVRAYDVDRLTEGGNDIHFLVMEYVDGRSLQQVVDDDGPLPIAAAVEYTRQAANGLAHAHSVGVVHRDVKPSNLLLDESGTIKLLDLGLARIFEDASEQPSLTIEHQQTVLGTADYLSPEQAVDSHGVDYRSDLYSLGCTLYFLLTGHPPFTEGSLTQRLLAHQNKAPAPVTASRPGVPATLASLIERMMAKRPDARFQTAEDLQGALTAWLRDHVGEIPTSERLVHRPARTAARSTQIPKARSGSASAGSSDAAARPKPKHLGKRRQNPSPAGSLPVGELEDGLTAFLRSLESDIEHDTVTPSFPTSETIVSNADIRDQPTDSDANVSVISHDWIVSQPTPGGTAGREQSGSAVSTLWAQISQARRSGAIPQWALAAMLGGALVTGGIAIAYLVPAGRQSNGSAAEGTNGQPDVTSDPAGAAAPEIEPGEDIRVGPDGHFSSIGAALLYVRETFHPL
ncbi:MAG: serine/threonine-protein kinase, partial [Planctomycetaceae bacterium]